MGSNRTSRSHSTCSGALASAEMLADPALDAFLPRLGRFGVLGTCSDAHPVPAGWEGLLCGCHAGAAAPAAGRQDLLTFESLKSAALSVDPSSSAKRCKCWVRAKAEPGSSRGREMPRAGDGEAAAIFLPLSSPSVLRDTQQRSEKPL